MLQREVVARMTAAPGTADYGRLTVMLQVRFRIARLFVVPPGAFRPAPKVESAVARLMPLGAGEAGDRRPGAVRARRGRRVLAAAQDAAQRAVGAVRRARRWRRAGIDPGARGETLPVADFVRLANRACFDASSVFPFAVRPTRGRSMRTIFCRDVVAADEHHVAQRHAERVGQEAQQFRVGLAVDGRRREADLQPLCVPRRACRRLRCAWPPAARAASRTARRRLAPPCGAIVLALGPRGALTARGTRRSAPLSRNGTSVISSNLRDDDHDRAATGRACRRSAAAPCGSAAGTETSAR